MPYLLQSNRFWLLMAAVLIGVIALVGVIINPEAIEAVKEVIIGIEALLGIAIYSDGQRRMGDRT